MVTTQCRCKPIAHPGLGLYEAGTGLDILDLYIYCSFLKTRPHLSVDTRQCVHMPFIVAVIMMHIFHFAMPFNLSFPQRRDKSLKVPLTCR